MRSLISLRGVKDYHPAAVLEAMRATLAPLGGMAAFVQPGQRVLLKPNLLAAYGPERAVTTHPAIVRAAILLVREAGGTPIVGDSPGVGGLSFVARRCGITAVLEETGAELADFSTPRTFEGPEGAVAKRLTLVKALSDADVLVTLPKLKTHGQMTLTGALKNQFGLVPGMLKSRWHFRLQRPEWLAALLLDIHRIARPALAIMDAIVGMEGKGPSAGRPRRLGAMLASRDLAAMDTLACHLIGLEPRHVPALVAAHHAGIGATTLADLEVVGEDWRRLQRPDFEKVSELEDLLRILPLPRSVLRWVREQWTFRPRIDGTRCQRCGLCRDGCPVSPPAIDPEAPALRQIDDAVCIRCYCCHELCPNQALVLERPWATWPLGLGRLAGGAGRLASSLCGRRRPADSPPPGR